MMVELPPPIRLISCKAITGVPSRGKPMQVPNERGSHTTSETFYPERYLPGRRRTLRLRKMVDSMRRLLAVLLILAFMTQMPAPVVSAYIYTSVPSYCMKPPPRSEGHCTIDMEGFYYDPRTNNCQRYEVGGCRTISGQSFGSRDDCLATCLYRTRRIQDIYITQ